VTHPPAAARVVSLVPSVTETLLAWGLSPVAVTRFCPGAGIPTVGGTKNPDVGRIVRLRPDVVLMDREENRRSDAEDLAAAGLAVVATDVRSVGEVADALGVIAAAVGYPLPDQDRRGGTPGPVLLPAAAPHRPLGVLVPIWRRPWMTVGAATYATSLLAAAGFVNVYADAAEPYPEFDLDGARARRPDRVLAPSEPYPFKERHRPELSAVAPVELVDGQDLFWWGWRTPLALARLAQLAASLAGA
jgi:ABC-type Fe3+-hydroxamate transport system substrate-binding protein